MTFALVLAITALACVALADAIRKAPAVFYLLAVAAVAVLAAGVYGLIGGEWWKPLILLVRRCMLPFALFCVVMFIGTLPRDSKLGLRMRSVRAELSIIAWILCMGHMCMYLEHYFVGGSSGVLRANVTVSFIVAMVLFVLLLILGVTSFAFVKKRMGARAWKRVQLLAYPFFLLSYIHLMLMLAPAAVGGGTAAQSVTVYTLVFVAYVALRLWRFATDRDAKEEVGAAASEAIAGSSVI